MLMLFQASKVKPWNVDWHHMKSLLEKFGLDSPNGRKVGSLKRRVRSQLARREMKNCTPLWREAHSKSKCTKHTMLGPLLEVEMSKKCTPLWYEVYFQIKIYKISHSRITFGSCDVEKVHAVVARSTFPNQNVQNTPCLDHFWRFRCRKSVEKVHAVVAQSTFASEKAKSISRSDHFWTLRCRFAWQAQGIVHLLKSEQNVTVL